MSSNRVERKKTIVAATATIIVFAITILCFGVRLSLNDDVMIGDVLSGYYSGEPSAMTVYMRVPLGVILTIFYRIVPVVPWFMVFQCACFVIGFYLVLRRALALCDYNRKNVILLITTLVLIFSGLYIGSLIMLQYTVTAAMVGTVGIFLMLTTDTKLRDRASERPETEKEKHSRNKNEEVLTYEQIGRLLGAGLLLLLCDQIRPQVFEMVLPFFCICGVMMFFERWLLVQRTGTKQSKKELMYLVEVSMVFLVTYLTLLGADRGSYVGDELEYYEKYNAARTDLYDYAGVWENEEAVEYYKKIGVDETEQAVLKNYAIAIDDTAGVQTFEAMARYSFNNKEIFSKDSIKNAVWILVHRMWLFDGGDGSAGDSIYGWIFTLFWLGTVFFMILNRDTISLVFLFPVGAGFVSMYLWLILHGRYPERVVISLYLIGAVTVLGILYRSRFRADMYNALIAKRTDEERRKIKLPTPDKSIVLKVMIIVVVVMLSAASVISIKTAHEEKNKLDAINSDCKELYDYMNANPLDVFITDVYCCVDSSISPPTNLVSTGGWMTRTPNQRIRLENLGIMGLDHLFTSGKDFCYVCREGKGMSPEILSDYLVSRYDWNKEFILDECISTDYGNFMIYKTAEK